MRTLGEIVREALPTAPIQILHQCTSGARRVNVRGAKGRAKGNSPYTKVEFVTTNTTPDDLMWFSGELGRSEERKPKYIGIIVWVPTADYERHESVAAVAPVPARSDEPTPREK